MHECCQAMLEESASAPCAHNCSHAEVPSKPGLVAHTSAACQLLTDHRALSSTALLDPCMPSAGTMQVPFDTGVVVYQNTSIVRSTFQEWDVALDPFTGNPAWTTYFFAANSPFYQTLPPPSPQGFQAFGAAVAKWNAMYATYFSALLTDNAAMPDFAALPAATRAVLLGPFAQLLGWLAAQNPAECGDPQWWQPLLPLWVGLVSNGPGRSGAAYCELFMCAAQRAFNEMHCVTSCCPCSVCHRVERLTHNLHACVVGAKEAHALTAC